MGTKTNIKKSKILVSGGWGYGNLGDDAILLGTCQLIIDNFDKCELTVMSYDKSETMAALSRPEMRVVDSIHRVRFGELAYRELKVQGKYRCINIRNKIITKVIRKIEDIFNGWAYNRGKNLAPSRQTYEKYFQECDYFIMSGGGYFNSWKSSFYSRVEEIELARKYGKPILLIGQTIGPFSGTYQEIFTRIIRYPKSIIVRDVNSREDIENCGVECSLMPDIALGQSAQPVESENITIIPAELDDAKQDCLVAGMKLFYGETKRAVKLLSTRLYENDLLTLNSLKQKFEAHGILVNVVVPRTYEKLHHEILKSRIIISKNLHGLILAWRSGIPIVSLNNERKFRGFLSQADAEAYVVELDSAEPEELRDLMLSALNTPLASATIEGLANEVKVSFRQGLERLQERK